jgi:two-component system, OmpR family, sensor kinase
MRDIPSPFTSIKYRLALLFFAITAGAIMIIYFYVVPQLESSLTDEKLQGLRKDATAYSRPLERSIGRDVYGPELDRLTRGIAEQAGAGVTLLGIPRNERDSGDEAPPYVISDSREAVTRLEPNSSTVLAAARERKVTTSTRSEGGKRLAQVAKPLYYKGEPAWVVVYSTPLSDVSDNVSLIERQILIAGGIALLVALISGYYASNALTKRLKRLERAAGEVAAGNFSDPIPIDSEDELGQLARAFNEMQRKLAGLDEARKEFIANASHELRTPIFSLGGFVELLQDEDIDETTRTEFLTTMREQVDRLQKLTTDLLDLSRLDAGSLEVELEPVPLLTLASQVADEFAAAAAMQQARIEVEPAGADEDVEAECDVTRVAQILRALLDNALSHTGEGTSVVVAARALPAAKNGRSMAELTVTDDGPGIPPDQLPKVFERFHSGDAGQGSGLGLSIARQLAERMLGSLTVTSRPRQTTFTLTLPAAVVRVGRGGRPLDVATPAPSGAGPVGSGRTPA